MTRLVILHQGEERSFELGDEPVIVGRRSTCDLMLEGTKSDLELERVRIDGFALGQSLVPLQYLRSSEQFLMGVWVKPQHTIARTSRTVASACLSRG